MRNLDKLAPLALWGLASLVGCSSEEASTPPAASKPPAETASAPTSGGQKIPFKSEAPKKAALPATPDPQAQPTPPVVAPPTPAKFAEPNPNPPKVAFQEKEHNFGNVIEGDEARHAFEFVNEGPGELILTNVQASCGCTRGKLTVFEGDAEKDYALGSKILPGQRGKIEAILATTGFQGLKTSRLTVSSNDPQSANSVLTISATIEKFFELTPPQVIQGQIFGKVGGEAVVKVSCLKCEDFDIVSWDVQPGGQKPEDVELEITKPDPARKNYAEVKVIFKPGGKEGIFHHQIFLKAKIPGQEALRDIRLMVSGTRLGAIGFTPMHLSAGLKRSEEEKTLRLTVQNRDPGRPMKITGVEIVSPQKDCLSAQTKTEMEGQTYIVELTVGKNCPPGVFKGSLKITTDHPEAATKEVPFSGVVK